MGHGQFCVRDTCDMVHTRTDADAACDLFGLDRSCVTMTWAPEHAVCGGPAVPGVGMVSVVVDTGDDGYSESIGSVEEYVGVRGMSRLTGTRG